MPPVRGASNAAILGGRIRGIASPAGTQREELPHGISAQNGTHRSNCIGSAGAIIRGTNYGDYEGWKDVDFNSPWDDKDNNIHLVFKISWRTRGHPKDDSLNDRYVADVRVSGKKAALGG